MLNNLRCSELNLINLLFDWIIPLEFHKWTERMLKSVRSMWILLLYFVLFELHLNHLLMTKTGYYLASQEYLNCHIQYNLMQVQNMYLLDHPLIEHNSLKLEYYLPSEHRFAGRVTYKDLKLSVMVQTSNLYDFFYTIKNANLKWKKFEIRFCISGQSKTYI